MKQPQDRPALSKTLATQREPDGALSDKALDQVSGGTDPAPPTTSNVMKTRHDTVKNSISNVR